MNTLYLIAGAVASNAAFLWLMSRYKDKTVNEITSNALINMPVYLIMTAIASPAIITILPIMYLIKWVELKVIRRQ